MAQKTYIGKNIRVPLISLQNQLNALNITNDAPLTKANVFIAAGDTVPGVLGALAGAGFGMLVKTPSVRSEAGANVFPRVAWRAATGAGRGTDAGRGSGKSSDAMGA
jgi:hypothetical protein